MKKISILLADDHSLMRMGLKSLIATESSLTVVGEAGNGEDAERLAGKEIARNLAISLSGTKHHMRTILAKLGAANRAEAVTIAIRKHMLKI